MSDLLKQKLDEAAFRAEVEQAKKERLQEDFKRYTNEGLIQNHHQAYAYGLEDGHDDAEAIIDEGLKERAYWNKEYSGDVELGRAKNKINQLEENCLKQLKSISWNLNRIANVLDEAVPNNKSAGQRILSSLRKEMRND